MNNFLSIIRENEKIKTVNIFINLDDFFHKLHRPIFDREFQTTGIDVSKQVVSNIINLLAHYRNWAIKEKLYPSLYLIYTDSMDFDNSVRVPLYREYYQKINNAENQNYFYINLAIRNSHDILKVICKYIKNCNLINSNQIEPSIIPYYIGEYYPADYNLLISRDEYDLQYACYSKWALMVPRGDKSKLVTKKTLWDYVQYYSGHNIEINNYLNPRLFEYCKALIGDKYRSIPKLGRLSWSTLIKRINNTDIDNYNDENIDIYLTDFLSKVLNKKINTDNYYNNLYCTSIPQQVNSILTIKKSIIDHQILSFDDPKALLELNNTVFRKYPLIIPFLTKDIEYN